MQTVFATNPGEFSSGVVLTIAEVILDALDAAREPKPADTPPRKRACGRPPEGTGWVAMPDIVAAVNARLGEPARSVNAYRLRAIRHTSFALANAGLTELVLSPMSGSTFGRLRWIRRTELVLDPVYRTLAEYLEPRGHLRYPPRDKEASTATTGKVLPADGSVRPSNGRVEAAGIGRAHQQKLDALPRTPSGRIQGDDEVWARILDCEGTYKAPADCLQLAMTAKNVVTYFLCRVGTNRDMGDAIAVVMNLLYAGISEATLRAAVDGFGAAMAANPLDVERREWTKSAERFFAEGWWQFCDYRR